MRHESYLNKEIRFKRNYNMYNKDGIHLVTKVRGNELYLDGSMYPIFILEKYLLETIELL